MSLMYDRMFRESWMMPTASDVSKQAEMSRSTRENVLGKLRQSEVIVANNVAQYYLSDQGKQWKLDRDFPNVAPPFSDCWIEYLTPPGYDMDRAGILASSVYMPEKDSADGRIKWLTSMYLFTEFEKGILGPICSISYLIGPSGEITYLNNDHEWFIEEWYGTNFRKLVEGGGFDASDKIMSVFHPALLTFCFLHCKNVDLITNNPPPKLSRAHQKRHKKPLIRYKTLDIMPIREILKREGNSEKTGLKMALHICRGHFKDFSKGNGLFGKYKGMYWWESQVRGSGVEGVVMKNYNVRRP